MRLADSITQLGPDAAGAVIVSGSHGGRYAAYLAVRAGVAAVIFNDAGVGRDDAGIAGLRYADACGVAAATVAHDSARIGDAADMLARGVVSHVNAAAARCGVAAGQRCAAVAERLDATVDSAVGRRDPPPLGEARRVRDDLGARRVVLIDSASLVRPEDAGQIVVTGSHGGLIGGDPAAALRVTAAAALFHDAGIGIDNAGTTRLPALAARAMPAATVAAASARVGDAASCFEDGVLSVVNAPAARLGVRPGHSARDFVARLQRLV